MRPSCSSSAYQPKGVPHQVTSPIHEGSAISHTGHSAHGLVFPRPVVANALQNKVNGKARSTRKDGPGLPKRHLVTRSAQQWKRHRARPGWRLRLSLLAIPGGGSGPIPDVSVWRNFLEKSGRRLGKRNLSLLQLERVRGHHPVGRLREGGRADRLLDAGTCRRSGKLAGDRRRADLTALADDHPDHR